MAETATKTPVDDAATSTPSEAPSLGTRALDRIGRIAKRSWQAGLGAAVVSERKLSETLSGFIQEGEAYQARARKQMQHARESAQEAKSKAAGKIHLIERRIDHGIDNTLHRFGVPTRTDFEQLNRLVNELTESVGELATQLRDANETKAKPRSANKHSSS